MTTRLRRPPRARSPRIGLALAGGGPLGGIYEVGALLALADSVTGLDLCALDVYVGVSSGGFVAAGLANGMSPSQMYRLFIAEGRDAAMSPSLFMRPALGEFMRRASALPGLALQASVRYLRHPRSHGVGESLALLLRAIPTGLFDAGAIDRFLRELFAAPGRTNDFRTLGRPLFLVATKLDTGESTVFGAPGHDHVPISRAIEASSALPGLFPPVEIDGQHYVDGALNKTLHASLALQAGADLLLCVNPLVPFDAPRAQRQRGETLQRLDQGGLPLVLAQTFRAIIRSRMEAGMASYARHYPDADVLLFEPAREDGDMFFANIFSYAQRERLCALAFATTRSDLRRRAGTLREVLGRHGLALDDARLANDRRTVADALCDPRPLRALQRRRRSVTQTTRELTHALDHLERHLARLRRAPA
ncbi:MAG TPA: patatin-like phospholipase family protein [Casimicrobiaceae bacterium]|nr:patatin-like phospholipase family protein [Casimicrobiaceae bacterium]